MPRLDTEEGHRGEPAHGNSDAHGGSGRGGSGSGGPPLARERPVRSVLRLGVLDDEQSDDLAVTEAEVVGHDQRVRQTGFVVVTVVAAPNAPHTGIIDDLDGFDGDVVADKLFRHKRPDVVTTPELPREVVD